MSSCNADSGSPAVHFFGEVTSTFDAAYKLAAAGEFPPFASVLARSQTAGRGQMRKHWDSPPGNIYATIRLPAQQPFTIDAAAIAFASLCAVALEKMGCPVLIKWPNDLVIIKNSQPGKVAGILLEEREGCIFAGIGINLAFAPQHLQGAALPAFVLPRMNQGPAFLWLNLARELRKIYSKTGWASWRQEADARLLWSGSEVELRDADTLTRGRLIGIAASGAAIIASAGQEQEFLTGSLSLPGK